MRQNNQFTITRIKCVNNEIAIEEAINQYLQKFGKGARVTIRKVKGGYTVSVTRLINSYFYNDLLEVNLQEEEDTDDDESTEIPRESTTEES